MIKIIIIILSLICSTYAIQGTLSCKGRFNTLNQNISGPPGTFFDGNSRIMKNSIGQEELWIIGGSSFVLASRIIFKLNLGNIIKYYINPKYLY